MPPGVLLGQHIVAHHSFRGEQAQEAKLREPAEEQTNLDARVGQPIVRHEVVHVSLVGERYPDVDIREKK
jgi:hypothetical protein